MEIDMNITEAIINSEKQPAVNARELWEALQSKQEFAKWIKNRLADFEVDVDYRFDKIVKTGAAGVTGKQLYHEYTLTLDTAKHLAMIERNEIGKKIRQYFIEVEKEFRHHHHIPTDITQSTIAVIEKINRQILQGVEVDKEVLRYAWNIGKLINRPLIKAVQTPTGVEEFIACYPAGEFSRGEVYAEYCRGCAKPVSARCFWPAVRRLRPFEEKRTCNCRYVVFE